VPIIGFVIAVIIAIFAFSQQQQAVDQARLALTQAAQAKEQGVTAVAVANEAATAQSNAQSTEAAALVNANEAATAQAEAEDERNTALAQINSAETAGARLEASSTAAAGAALSTIRAGERAMQTAQSQSADELATRQAEFDALATTQAETAAQLATATAQIDLAEFARQAAEEDRILVLTQAWSAATLIADMENQLATAEAIIAGATATPLPQPAATAAQGAALALVNDFRSNSGQLTFQYPEDWATQETNSGAVLVASDARMFENTSAQIAPGVFMQILVAPVTAFGLNPGDKPVDALQTWITLVTNQNPEIRLGEPGEVTIGAYRAARVEGSDASGELVITTIDVGNDVAGVIFAFSSRGDMPLYLPTVDAIIASITYQA
jgi:hypothetical protein